MNGALDDELRAATLAFVLGLRERHFGRIPRDELSKGITIRGERIPIWNYQKGIHKPAILGPEGAALTVQTSAESPYADSHDPDAGHFVYKYRGDNPQQADNVAMRYAWVQRKPLCYLVAVDPGVYDAVAPVYVVGDDPAKLEFTLVADQVGATVTALAVETAVELRREYVTRAVMLRLHQHNFRRLVLSAYGEQCCICRLQYIELLDAAHILEDKHPKGEPLITNGLGLCKIHHSAYDSNIIGIDPDARVHIREDVLKEKDGPMLKHGLQELHGAKLVLPRKADLRPNRDFLLERFDRFRAA
jgi:putative restriction endonuclease